MFQKFSLPHRSTLLSSNVVKFVQREIGEIVHYLPDKKFWLPLKLLLLRGSRPKSARASPQHLLTLFQISSKSFQFRQSYSRTREDGFFAP